MPAQNIRALIFDFDGTLVRSHAVVYAAIDRLTKNRRSAMPSAETLRKLEMRELLQILEVRAWAIPWLTWRARRLLRHSLDTLALEPGLAELLRAAKASGLKLGLVSSNSKSNIDRVLQRHGLNHIFEAFAVGAGLFHKHKKFNKLVEALKIDKNQILSVGDEVRDIEAAHRAGLRAVAVTWGFHSGARLRKHAPESIVDTAEELARYLDLSLDPRL